MNHIGDEFALQVLTDWLLHFLNHIVNSDVQIISKLLWLEWEICNQKFQVFPGEYSQVLYLKI